MILRIIKYSFIFSALLFFTNCEKILFVEDISQEKAVLLAPLNNTEVNTGAIVFSWEEIENAEKYQLLVATPSFESASQILLDTLVSNRSFTMELLTNSYEWKLRAVNSGYNSIFSNANFIVKEADGFSETTVVLTSPVKGLNTNIASQMMHWESLQDATEYRLQIWSPDTSGNLVLDEVQTEISFLHPFDEGSYTWQVRGQNSTQNTLFSSRTLLVDSTVPGTVNLLVPNDAANITETLVDFSWSRTSIKGSVEVDSIYVYENVELTSLRFKEQGVSSSYQQELTDNTYYWYVQSFDAAGNSNTKTAVFSFNLN
jgi:hypothetical protein